MTSNTFVGRWVVGLMTMVLVTMLAGPAGADWTQTGAGPYDYDDPGNWSGGLINGIWPASVMFGADQSVTFDSNLSLTTGLSLLFDPTGSGFNLRFLGDGAERTVTLGGDLNFNLVNNAASTVIGFGSTTAGDKLNVALGGDRIFSSALPRANGRGVVFVNDVSGPYDITKTDSGVIIFEGSVTFSGDLVVQEGEVNLSIRGAMPNVAGVTVGGFDTETLLSLDNRQGGQLGGGAINVANRLNDTATLTAIGNSRLHLRANNISATSETVGTYVSQIGLNRVSAVQSDSGPSNPEATLTVTNLNRAAGSVMLIGGGAQNTQGSSYNDLGQGAGAGNARILATQINDAAPTAALVNGIVPWVVIADVANFGLSAFATYGANGFKPYGLDEAGTVDGSELYVTTLAAAGATDNVLLTTTETISGTKTVNSLNTSVTVNRTVAGDTLVLTSGALLAQAGLQVYPKVDFNAGEGVVVVTHQTTFKDGLHNDGGNGVTLASAQLNLGQDIFLDGASTYTGPTRIAYGIVCDRAVGGIPVTSAVRIDANGYLNIWDAASTTIGSLAGCGTVTGRNYNDVAMTLVTGGNNDSTTFDGTILNITRISGGTLGLTKTGSGTMTLTGTNHTYQGATLISGGSLLIDGALPGAYGDITVANSGTLGGTGWIERNVQVDSGGTLTAGTLVSNGIFTIQADLSMNSGATLRCNIDGDTAYDQLVVTGTTVDINADSGVGATLEAVLGPGYTPVAGTTFTIIDKQSVGAMAGTFESGTITDGGVTFSVDYAGGVGGNDIVLTVLPKGTLVTIR